MPVENAVNHPQYVQGGHADFLVKSDYLKQYPQAYAEFIKNYGGEFTFIDMLESLGLTSFQKSIPHQNPFYRHAFEEKDDRWFKIGSVVTPQAAAGGTVVVALAPTEMKSLNGRMSSRPRKDELIISKSGTNWNIVEKNITTNPHQLTLKPIGATIAETFAANDAFAIIGPAYAEATGQPKGLVSDFGTYINLFAIMKETDLTSGTNMTTLQPWQPIEEMKGYAYINGAEHAELRHKKNMATMVVHGQLGDGNITQYSPDFDTNVENKYTEGLLAAYFTGGHMQTYDAAAGYDFDDLNRATSWYRQNKLPNADILVMQGGSMVTNIQLVLREYAKDSNLMGYFARKYFSRMKYNANEPYKEDDYFLDLNFKGINIDGYNLLFRGLSELNGLYGDGNTGFDYEGLQLFMPIWTVRDPKAGTTIPTMRMVHRGQDAGGYQRSMEIWRTGGAGPIQKTDEWDVMRSFFRSEFLLAIAGHHWLLGQQSGTSDTY